MTISPRFLDEVRNRLTLSDVIGQRVKVTRAGREYKACCPFHKEKSPSFTINDDKQFYHCFGCGAHGDVIGFVMRNDNLSFPEAVELLAGLAGLTMPRPDPASVKKAEREKSLHSLLEEATLYFESVLHGSNSEKDLSGAALGYLLGRGLTEDTLAAFRVGYAPGDGQMIRRHLRGKGHTDAQMIEAGILKESSRGSEPYAFFRERIMFPVSDRRGRIIAFGGRILPDHIRPPDREGFKPPKYINSGDTPLFDKGRTLYAESLAREAARGGHTVIVTEGYMDVIACHQAGFRGAVAPMGTALTEEQILSLWSMGAEEEKVPVLCFDGDNAGRRAASRGCERILPLLKPGHSIRLAFLPEGEDPDSLLKTGGPPALRTILENSLSLFEFIWTSHTAGRRLDTPESRAGVVKALENEVNAIADREVQSHYRALLRARVSEAFFRRPQDKRTGPSPRRTGITSLKPRRPGQQRGTTALKILLASALNHPEAFDDLEEALAGHPPAPISLDRLRQEILRVLGEENTGIGPDGLRDCLIRAGFEKDMDDILNESVYVHASFARPEAVFSEMRPLLLAWLSDMLERGGEGVYRDWQRAFADSSTADEDRIRERIALAAGGGADDSG
ncbi:MAG: DNA primase [Alphaproteobacteria bacterium]|nr:DNA primase [Alphaproteobacteria bacterium]